MIQIRRGDTPDTLKKNATDLRETDCTADDVKSALILMQHNKCCYCEKPFTDIGRSDKEIEHYFPKSKILDNNGDIDWGRANQWSNLLYACSQCNGDKKSQIPRDSTTGKLFIIDPSDSDPTLNPEHHITFDIDLETEWYRHTKNNDSQIGKSTIECLKLKDRHDLSGAFKYRRLKITPTLLDLAIALENNDELERQRCLNMLRIHCGANQPYASFTRAFISMQLHVFNTRLIPRIISEKGWEITTIEFDLPEGSEVVV